MGRRETCLIEKNRCMICGIKCDVKKAAELRFEMESDVSKVNDIEMPDIIITHPWERIL